MTRHRRLAALLPMVALLVSSGAFAQSPPTGPAQIFNRTNQGRDKAEVERAAQTGDNAAQAVAGDAGAVAGDAGAADPHAGAADPHAGAADPHAGAANPHTGSPHGGTRDPHAVLAEPELPTAQPDATLRPGTIQIDVFDPSGAPAANAEIVLGVMASQGGRTEQRAQTDAEGHYTFRTLSVGSQQAYRVNVLSGGAKFSSTPFRLPDDTGYRVRVPLRATTNDTALLFQVIGQTVVELRDDRLHITQQARLANAGERVIVLPKDGLEVNLPPGFTAFSWQDQMSDQKGEEVAGKGFRMRGSLPPGTVTLAWTFDLPRSGREARIQIAQPWRTYTYRVISEAPEGLKLRVTDFPEAERVEDNQRQLLFTQVQRKPSEARLETFTIKLDGIPGPGPGRWVAAGLALIAALLGLARAFKPADDLSERREVLKVRKAELIALAKAVEAEHARGDIGPNFRSERLAEIQTELAVVLRDEELLSSASKAVPSKPAARPA